MITYLATVYIQFKKAQAGDVGSSAVGLPGGFEFLAQQSGGQGPLLGEADLAPRRHPELTEFFGGRPARVIEVRFLPTRGRACGGLPLPAGAEMEGFPFTKVAE